MGRCDRMRQDDAYESHYNVFGSATKIVSTCLFHDNSWEETEDLLESLHYAVKALDKAWA